MSYESSTDKTGSLLYIWLILITGSIGAFAQNVDEASLNKGLSEYQSGNYEAAAQSFQAAMANNANSPQLNFNLGAANYKQNDYPAAAEAFELATAAPDSQLRQNAYYNLGNALFQSKEFDKAAAAYKQALRISPQDAQAKHNLELALIQNNNQDQQDQDKQDQQDNIIPSAFAKQLKAQAEILVSQRLYSEAHKLMQQGLKSDETVSAFQSFMKRLKDVSDIDKLEGKP